MEPEPGSLPQRGLFALALLAAIAATGWAAAQALRLDHVISLIAWFLIVLVGHDIVFVPLYTLLDRVATAPARGRKVAAINHVRVPGLLSALMLLVYAPLILQANPALYHGATGRSADVYFSRWLGLSAALFVGSALVYLLRALRAR